MTLANSLFARFSRAFKKGQAEQPDAFDMRLQKLSTVTARKHKQAHSVFKNRAQRLVA
jgi:hypothetical protein